MLDFDANEKLLHFTAKLKTASDKHRINMATWSSLPFVFCRKRNFESYIEKKILAIICATKLLQNKLV